MGQRLGTFQFPEPHLPLVSPITIKEAAVAVQNKGTLVHSFGGAHWFSPSAWLSLKLHILDSD